MIGATLPLGKRRRDQRPAPRPLPLRIGPYRIDSLLHRSGMSDLYLASDGQGQQLAIKTLPPLGTAQQRCCLCREAEILLRIDHPHLAAYRSHGEWAEGPYIATTYLPAVSWQRCYSFSLQQKLALLLQIAAALEHLHQQAIIHADLQPANILVSASSGQLRVIDFGSALIDGRPPLPGQLLGTPPYLSPEQHSGSATPRSDIYALGVLGHALLTGKRHPRHRDLAALPPAMRTIIGTATATDPAQRYPRIADCSAAIRGYLAWARRCGH